MVFLRAEVNKGKHGDGLLSRDRKSGRFIEADLPEKYSSQGQSDKNNRGEEQLLQSERDRDLS